MCVCVCVCVCLCVSVCVCVCVCVMIFQRPLIDVSGFGFVLLFFQCLAVLRMILIVYVDGETLTKVTK